MYVDTDIKLIFFFFCNLVKATHYLELSWKQGNWLAGVTLNHNFQKGDEGSEQDRQSYLMVEEREQFGLPDNSVRMIKIIISR